MAEQAIERKQERFSRMNILSIKTRLLRLLKTWSEKSSEEIAATFSSESGGAIYRITNDIVDLMIEKAVKSMDEEEDRFIYYLGKKLDLQDRIDVLTERDKYQLQDKLKVYGLDLEFGKEPLGFENNLSYRVTVL